MYLKWTSHISDVLNVPEMDLIRSRGTRDTWNSNELIVLKFSTDSFWPLDQYCLYRGHIGCAIPCFIAVD
jgi:hypothetical protein